MTRRVPAHRQAHVCECGAHAFVGLTLAAVALIDPEDAPLIDGYHWSCNSLQRHSRKALRRPGGRGIKRPAIVMHRLIIGAPDGVLVDHINGDQLDNRKNNLRLCSIAENVRNRRRHSRRKGGQLKGAFPYGKGGRWFARICANGVREKFGPFDTEEEAARAYDEAAVRLHGEFACTNQMLGLLP